jgi:APA family basic amino acid/polyamine antiporter
MINCIIGSGVFGLPSVIARLLGSASPLAWIFAAMGTALVMACFAEVSSRFEASGGVYLYTRAAFGRTFGIAIAWIGWLTRLTAAAANANLFVIYLTEFWPSAKGAVARPIVLTCLLGFLAAVNYLGVRRGLIQSNVFTVAKLTTLGLFILAAIGFLGAKHPSVAISVAGHSSATWLHAVLLLMFAYGGYETALMIGGEAKNPRRDYPFALFVALGICTVIYTSTQVAIIFILPPALMTDRPMAAAAQHMFGGWAGQLVSVGVLLSTYGYLSANILGFPRILFAQAENRDLPPVLASVHPRYRTPHLAILFFTGALWLFSLMGSFEWNVTVSAMARLIYYGSVCAALPLLRRRPTAPPALFQLPWGDLVAALAVGVSLLLFPKIDRASAIVLGTLAVCVAANAFWAKKKWPSSSKVKE